MNKFANYENREITINTYRIPGATATDLNDLLFAFERGTDEKLTASINTEDELLAWQKWLESQHTFNGA